jgi:hypothetical protein
MYLQGYDGQLSFATDAWTSPNHRAFVAVTVHLEKDGWPFSMLLDLVEVAQSHSGMNLVKAFVKILEDFGIEKKILSIICDNASANDTIIEAMEGLLTGFADQASRTRCFAHIINLVAKMVMHQFDTPKQQADVTLSAVESELRDLEKDDLDTEDMRDGADDNGGCDNQEGWVDERETMLERKRERLEASVKPMQLVLTKVSDSSTDFGKKTHWINRLIVEKAVLQPNLLDNNSSALMA